MTYGNVDNCATRWDYMQFPYNYVQTALNVSSDNFAHHQEQI